MIAIFKIGITHVLCSRCNSAHSLDFRAKNSFPTLSRDFYIRISKSDSSVWIIVEKCYKSFRSSFHAMSVFASIFLKGILRKVKRITKKIIINVNPAINGMHSCVYPFAILIWCLPITSSALSHDSCFLNLSVSDFGWPWRKYQNISYTQNNLFSLACGWVPRYLSNNKVINEWSILWAMP